jgi:hypothetical protein
LKKTEFKVMLALGESRAAIVNTGVGLREIENTSAR